jgi:hypothetical protein
MTPGCPPDSQPPLGDEDTLSRVRAGRVLGAQGTEVAQDGRGQAGGSARDGSTHAEPEPRADSLRRRWEETAGLQGTCQEHNGERAPGGRDCSAASTETGPIPGQASSWVPGLEEQTGQGQGGDASMTLHGHANAA